MTDGFGSSTMAIALAAPGDGPAAVALGALTADGLITAPAAVPPALAHAIDARGGQVPLPYGHGRCLITRIGNTVAGMVYTAPPIRWVEDHPPAQRAGLVRSLIEIELLAVAKPHRGRGIATALLTTAKETARSAGSHLAFAKVKIGAFTTMRWYRKRGYTTAAQAEPVVFRTRSGSESCDDGSDGYQLAVKALQPGVVLRRRLERGSSIPYSSRNAMPEPAVADVLYERYAGRLPDSLEALAGPEHGLVGLPLHIAWSGLRPYDLDRPRQRMGLYRTVLAEGQRDDITRFLNRDLLLAQWPLMRTMISRHVREVWEAAFPELEHWASTGTGNHRSPSSAPADLAEDVKPGKGARD